MLLKQKKINYLATGQTITLLLIMFIDGMGMSLVLPLIGDLFSKSSNAIIDPSTSKALSNLYYGISLAGFSGAMIFGASILGQMSDKYGRKLTLRISLLGAMLSYLICAFSIFLKAPILFLFGRIVAGLTAGSIPVVQAMLTDLDKQENKMTSIGKVMFAVTSGYIFGPILSGVAFIGQESNLMLPFILVAALCLLCVTLLELLKETISITSNNAGFSLISTFKEIKNLWLHQSLRLPIGSFFLFQCAWALFYQYLPKQLTYIKHSSQGGSILMAAVGAGMCFAFCFIVPEVQKRASPKKLVTSCVALFSVITALFLTSLITPWLFYVMSVFMALLYGVAYSAMLAFLLSICDETQKGLILGSIASICAISATLSALLGSTLNTFSNSYFFSGLFLISFISLWLFILKPYQSNLKEVKNA